MRLAGVLDNLRVPRGLLLSVVLLCAAYGVGAVTGWAVPGIGRWLPYLAALGAPALATAFLWRAYARDSLPRRRV